MIIRRIKSLNNGLTVLERQYPSAYGEVRAALWAVDDDTALMSFAKYIGRFGYSVCGSARHSFTNGKVKAAVLESTRTATISSPDDGSHEVTVVLVQTADARSLAEIEKTSGGKPTVVAEVAPNKADTSKPKRRIEANEDPDRRTSAEAAGITNQLLEKLRSARNERVKVPRLTRVAQMLQVLDAEGYIEFSAYRGRPVGTTNPLSYDEKDAAGRMKILSTDRVYGQRFPSLIVFDPYHRDALSKLAHEITHAFLLHIGEQQNDSAGPIFQETEAKRVENEIRKLMEGLDVDPDYNGVLIPNPDFYLK